MPIKSFADKHTEKLWLGHRTKILPASLIERAENKLAILNAAVRLEDCDVPPGNKLEALKGDRKGQYSIRINQQWRICFRWDNGDVHDVEIVDYH